MNKLNFLRRPAWPLCYDYFKNKPELVPSYARTERAQPATTYIMVGSAALPISGSQLLLRFSVPASVSAEQELAALPEAALWAPGYQLRKAKRQTQPGKVRYEVWGCYDQTKAEAKKAELVASAKHQLQKAMAEFKATLKPGALNAAK